MDRIVRSSIFFASVVIYINTPLSLHSHTHTHLQAVFSSRNIYCSELHLDNVVLPLKEILKMAYLQCQDDDGF
eukprot:m.149415 g.149415  ORF g.149415 m.149415 type:complete len:73 (-) comp16157_c0_seq13:921-1139(-)